MILLEDLKIIGKEGKDMVQEVKDKNWTQVFKEKNVNNTRSTSKQQEYLLTI